MVNYYLIDTCVWRDFYEERIGSNGRLLGKQAVEFINILLKKGDKIIYSDSLIIELRIDYSEEEIKDMLTVLFLSGSLIRIAIAEEEYTEAQKLSKSRNLPLMDCLNAVQARNYKAIIVTQDNHYFEKLSDIVKSIRP